MSAASFCRSAIAATLCVLTAIANAQSSADRLPISLDADSSVLDRRNGEIVFSGLRITQGAISIEARSGVTKLGGGANLDFADSTWEFTGDVKIDIETASIRSETASLYFRNHRLQRANVSGQPAKFDDVGTSDREALSAVAENFEYNLGEGLIRFLGGATLREGDNEVTGADLLYDLNAKRVNFQGDPAEGERVRITIVPDTEDLDTP